MEHFPLVDRLHTDVLEEKYGKISSRVLIHNDQIRLAHLIDSKGISRTFAITFFVNDWTNDVKKINEEIKNGKPIGKVFRDHEYAIRKNVLEVYKIKIPNWLKKDFDTNENYAKARLSEFYAKKKDKSPEIYGIVVEIYSPDFRIATINKTDMAQESALTPSLEKKGFSKEEIWKRIGRENDYEDCKQKFMSAKKESDKIEKELKKKINRVLKNQKL
ncbi:MAG: hypothetical protein AABX03_01155 [Nanoarchaeota archaeon]